jgi:hypothetical protein
MMNDIQVRISEEEREFLASLLETAMKETRVEEHRTRKISYREHILHKERLLAGLLSKLASEVETVPR